jgi:hypothetical protein
MMWRNDVELYQKFKLLFSTQNNTFVITSKWRQGYGKYTYIMCPEINATSLKGPFRDEKFVKAFRNEISSGAYFPSNRHEV